MKKHGIDLTIMELEVIEYALYTTERVKADDPVDADCCYSVRKLVHEALNKAKEAEGFKS